MDIMKNKLGITSKSELQREEERITKQKIINLWLNNDLDLKEVGSFETLKYIHKEIFEELYDWAGEIRKIDIGKDGFQFARSIYLNELVVEVSNMPQSTFDEIIDKYAEMNVIHPFREGNGRSSRVWLDHILKSEIKKVVDWNNIDKVEYYNAMVDSHLNTSSLKKLLFSNLTDNINDISTFFKGIDSSYWYENMNEYRTIDIYNQYYVHKSSNMKL